MPKRRKNRKNRKGHTKKPAYVTNKENTSTSCDVARACFDDDSLNKSKAVSPPELVTPLRNPNVRLNKTEPFHDELSPIRTTPVNKKRSLTRPERTKHSSMNVTNLNVLFDSNFLHHGNIPRSTSNVCVNKSNISLRKESDHSIPKLHSPLSEQPISVSQSSQTEVVDGKKSESNEIFETPRISKVLLLDKSESDEVYDMRLLNNHRSRTEKVNNCSRNMKFYNGEVNVNPYLNNNAVGKDGSFGEISFFSSNLFQHKSSSTPIEKLNQASNIVDYLKESLRKQNAVDGDSFIDKLDLPNMNNSVAPKLNSNLNFNKTPLTEKVLNKEDSLGSIKIQAVSLSKRRSYKTSPKSNKILSHSRIFNKRHTLTYSRLNISRRSSVDSVDSISRNNRSGFGEKLLNRLKKYTRVSQRWSHKVMELCGQIGVQLKNSLSSVCNIYSDRSMLASSEKNSCKCDEYREEISSLNLKIQELTEEVRIVKLQMEEEKSNKENIKILSRELNEVRDELSQYRELRAELESLKEQMKCLKSSASATPSNVPVPPPPPPCLPPPPPPPPPPPLPPISTAVGNPLKISKRIRNNTIPDDNSRPVISLDDILKVKLKKASDRSSCLTPTSRRLSQPVVSMDMLRQVKLRPASRPSFRPDTPDTASSGSTSPHSSLCRRNLVGKRERDGS